MTTKNWRIGDAKRYHELASVPVAQRTVDDVMELWGIQKTWGDDPTFWDMVKQLRLRNGQPCLL
jgi:hypothetical protein